MSDVYLQPIMDRLNSNRGPTSAIFSILPAVTLATGEKKFLFKKKLFFL
jgi:hypothetical protein